MLKIAGYTFFSKFLAAVITFAIIVLISRFLGPEERGVCSLYLLIISLSATISEMAGGATSAFLLKKFNPRYLQNVQLIWSALPSILVPGLFFMFDALKPDELFILIFASWIHSGLLMQQHLFLGMQKFIIFNLFQLFIPAFILFFFLLFVQFQKDRYSYYYATLISWLLIFCIGYLILRIKYIPKFNKDFKHQQGFKEVFRAGVVNQMGHMVSLFNARLVFFILPAVQLGVWSNTLNLAEGMFMIAGSLGQVLYSMMANQQKGRNSGERWLRIGFLANLVLTFGGVIVLVLIPDRLWIHVFGAGFAGIQPLLLIIMGGIFFQSFFLLISYRLSAEGMFLKNLYALILGASANLTITLILLILGKYSLTGGAIALAVGWTTGAFVALFYLKKHLPYFFETDLLKK